MDFEGEVGWSGIAPDVDNLRRRLSAIHSPTVSWASLKRYVTAELDGEASVLGLPFSALFFFIFAVCLFTHANMSLVFELHTALENELVNGAAWYGGTKSFKEVTTPGEFWSWMEAGLAPRIWRQDGSGARRDYYGRALAFPKWDRWLGYNKVIGGIQLMQEREQPGDCETSKFNLYYQSSCKNGGTANSDFGKNVPSGMRGFTADDDEKYRAYLDVLAPPADVNSLIGQLKDGGWIDRFTSAIVVRLTVYNGELSSGLLCAAKMSFEFQNGGLIVARLLTQTIHTEPYEHMEVLVPDFFFLLCVLYVFSSELLQVVVIIVKGDTKKLRDYCTVWNLVDWATVGIGVFQCIWWLVIVWTNGSVVDRIVHYQNLDTSQFNSYYDVWNAEPTTNTTAGGTGPYRQWGVDRMQVPGIRRAFEDVNDMLDLAIAFKNVMDATSGVFVLLTMTRFFRSFSAQPRLSRITETFRVATVDLIHFAIVMGTIFLTYAICGYALFGRSLWEFQSIWFAVMSTFNLLMGEVDFAELSRAQNPFFAAIWYVSFMFMVFLILLNMLLAIILESYDYVHRKAPNAPTLWAQASKMIRRHREAKLGRRISLEAIQEALAEIDDQSEDNSAIPVSAKDLVGTVKNLGIEQAEALLEFCRDWVQNQQESDETPTILDNIKVVNAMITRSRQLGSIAREGSAAKERSAHSLRAPLPEPTGAIGEEIRKVACTDPTASRLDTQAGLGKLGRIIESYGDSPFLAEAIDPILAQRAITTPNSSVRGLPLAVVGPALEDSLRNIALQRGGPASGPA